jgi:putative DNA-invertase from lambdoid prophage Rac
MHTNHLVAIYARVSTEDQHCEMQLAEMRGYAERQGWTVSEYVEHASGKAGSRRPVLDRLLGDARMKRFDVLLVWKLDRFGRSLKHIIENMETLDAAGVRFLVPSQGIDTDQRSPMGKFLMQIIGAFAELERELIRERVNAGVQEYKRAYDRGEIGKKRHSRSGKDLPAGRPKRIFRRDEAAHLRELGHSWRAIAKHLGVSASTIRDALSH